MEYIVLYTKGSGKQKSSLGGAGTAHRIVESRGPASPALVQKEEKKRFTYKHIVPDIMVTCWTRTLRLPYAECTEGLSFVCGRGASPFSGQMRLQKSLNTIRWANLR